MTESELIFTSIEPAWLVLIAALAVNVISVVFYIRNIASFRQPDAVVFAAFSAGIEALSRSLLRMSPERGQDEAGRDQHRSD